ncbi:MAG: T9SS type A sorting domain-containing protein [Candidatus Eisenbacteria bacterium]|nr:T9SS type A sorting domain-containing protein [Candidatus Eisenbacteria bacterium]
MRRRLFLLVGLAAALLMVSDAAAQIRLLYDVDFGRPPHLAGSAPVVGAAPAPRKTPTSVVFGDPTVVAALGAMTEQPCEFGNGTTGYDQLEFAVDPSQPDGFPAAYSVYFAEMDVLIESMSATDLFRVLFDCPTVNVVEFYPSGDIRLHPTGETIGQYDPGTPVRLEAELDFDAATWSIWLDGSLVHTGLLTGTYLRAIRLNLNGVNVANRAAVDDLRLYGGALPPFTDLLYDVDYGWPPHQIAQPPVLGAGPAPRKVPTRIAFGDPTVVAALGALNQQPCRFGNGNEGYDQLRFCVSPNYPDGFPDNYDEYVLSVDVLVQTLGDGDVFVIYFDSPSIHYVAFHGDGTIQGPENVGLLGYYQWGTPVRVLIAMNMIEDTWSILIDGAHVYTGAAEAEDLVFVRLSLSPGLPYSAVGVDNLYFWGIGREGAVSVDSASETLWPATLSVSPNPAREGARIHWEAASRSEPIRVEIVSVDGRRLWSQDQSAEKGQLHWSGRDYRGAEVPSGIYYVRLISGHQEIGRRSLVLQR